MSSLGALKRAEPSSHPGIAFRILGSDLDSVGEALEQVGQNPLGHAPDDGVLQLEGGDLPALPGHFKPDGVMGLGVEESRQSNPPSRSDLGVQHQRRPRGREKYVGPDGYGRQDRSAGNDIVEGAGEVVAGELNSHLLGHLPNHGRQEILVPGFAPSTWKRHVAGPRVSGPLGPAYQQNGIGVRGDDDRYCGPYQRGIVVVGRLALGQALSQEGKPAAQCECDPQLPPQQPPPGGGPSLL